MGVIDSALEHASKGKKIYWVGGLEAYSIGDLEDLHRLNSNEKDSVKNKRLLSDFSNFNQYMDMAEETHDPEMKRAVKIVQNYKNLSDKLRHLRKMTVKDESSADVIVTTAHRCKGLEWDHVQLMDDFMDPLDRMMDTDTRSDEINLLYVAATRAKKCLALNGVAIGMIREHTARTKSGLPIPTS
jgi:superfamily I DNA/RNA helicase